MELFSVIGITGSIIIVVGAIYPIEVTKVPVRSVKNRLLTLGTLILLLYASVGYLSWLSVFFINIRLEFLIFIYLEILVVIASILMMVNTNDRRDTWIIGGLGIALLIWSRFLLQWRSMSLFIVAFTILSLGYAFDMHSVRRYIALTIGGLLIALSSYLAASRIFFGLNIFFALFSLYYAFRLHRIYKRSPSKKK